MQPLNLKINTTFKGLSAWIVILAFCAINTFAFWLWFFPAAVAHTGATYNNGPSFIWHYFAMPIGIPFVLLFSVPFLIRFRRLSWKKIDQSNVFRFIFFVCGLLVCWILVGEQYNFYLNSWFTADRILLPILCILILLHPIFIPLFSSTAILFYAQYFAPFDWLYNYDIRPLFNVLIIGNCLVLLDIRDIKVKHLLATIFLTQLSAYFYSALAKINMSPNLINWVTDNELFLLPLEAHLRGWMSHQGLRFYDPLTHFLTRFGVFISMLILGIEFACLWGVANRKFLMGILISTNVMHVAIAFTCGIFFWIWFVLNMTLIAVLLFQPQIDIFFSKPFGFLKSAAFVSIGILIFQPIAIGWYDSRYQWYVDMEVKTQKGEVFALDKNGFGGYSYLFVHDALKSTIPFKLTGLNGYSAMWQEAMMFKAITLENADSLRNIVGKDYYDSAEAQKLSHFLSVYLNNYNNHVNTISLAAPKQLYMYRPKLPFLPNGEKVTELSVWLNEYVYADNRYHLIHRQKTLYLKL